VLIGGANRAWSDELDDGHRAAIEGAGVLLLQREVPDAVDLVATRVATAAGVPVILDAGGSDAPIPDELLASVDCLSPNLGELAALSGIPAHEPDAVARGVSALRRRGAREVLVKLGADGCSHHPWPESAPVHQPAFEVPAVDTTGAGDCFTAAWAVAMLRGEDIPGRCRFACAAAGCCIGKRGAMPSMPDAAVVADLLAGA